MNRNNCILSVKPSPDPIDYPKPKLDKKDLLEVELQKRGIDVNLGDILKGGTVSQVYEGKLNEKRVVVKHTENTIPFDPTEFFIGREGHNVDTKVLKLLVHSNEVHVPEVLYHFSDITTTVMQDVRLEGFELMIKQIVKGDLIMKSAESIGRSLAYLAKESRKWKPFKTNESAKQNIYERGLELRMAYPKEQTEYLELEEMFVKNNEFWVWPDGHSKNVFIKGNGEVLFIDFGRSHWGDQRYMLPNFLAHIGIYGLAGYIKHGEVRKYIQNCFGAYRNIEPINEEVFCKYFAMEVLHRVCGKWIQGIETKEQKLKLYKFGLTIVDSDIDKIDKLLRLVS